jgi:hypothetical protein
MTQEEKFLELRSMVNFINMRLGEFYNRGFFNGNPTRKEIFYMVKETAKVLQKTSELKSY